MSHKDRTYRARWFIPVSVMCVVLTFPDLLAIEVHAQESKHQEEAHVVPNANSPFEEIIIVGERRELRHCWEEVRDWATDPNTLAIAVTINLTISLSIAVALPICCRRRSRDSRD